NVVVKGRGLDGDTGGVRIDFVRAGADITHVPERAVRQELLALGGSLLDGWLEDVAGKRGEVVLPAGRGAGSQGASLDPALLPVDHHGQGIRRLDRRHVPNRESVADTVGRGGIDLPREREVVRG